MNREIYERQVRDAARFDSQYPDAWYHLGLTFSALERYDDALMAFTKANDLNPRYLDPAISRCFTLAEAGKTASSINEFRRLRVSNLDDFNVIFPLGVFCMRHGWTSSGIAQLVRAQRIRPNAPYVLAHVAAAMDQAGEVNAVKARLEQIAALHDKLACELEVDREFFAAVDLQACKTWSNPFAVKRSILDANALSNQGDVKAAESVLLDANARTVGHTQLMNHMGRFLQTQSRWDEAVRWHQAAITVDGLCSEAYVELGFIHADHDRFDEAKRCLHQAVVLRPLYPDYRYYLALLLVDGAEREQAVTELRRVVELNPGYNAPTLHLASLLLSSGSFEDALRVLERCANPEWPEVQELVEEVRRCQAEAVAADAD